MKRRFDVILNNYSMSVRWIWDDCRSWYNGSYTNMAKPMKTLKLHYPMIQFLIKVIIIIIIIIIMIIIIIIIIIIIYYAISRALLPKRRQRPTGGASHPWQQVERKKNSSCLIRLTIVVILVVFPQKNSCATSRKKNGQHYKKNRIQTSIHSRERELRIREVIRAIYMGYWPSVRSR